MSVPSLFGSHRVCSSALATGVPTRTIPRATPPTNTDVVFVEK
jgi:hypothetical protein